MKVRTKDFRWKDTEMELSDLLTPTNDDDGIAERAYALAQTNAEVIGRLVAHLVETGAILLPDALTICGVYGEVEEVTGE
jgi:hypothetical protein